MRADTAALVIGLVSLGAAGGGATIQQGGPSGTAKVVTTLDPALDQLVAPDATIEQVQSGFVNTEGPFWVQKGDPHLLFSDIPGNALYRWSPTKGLAKILAPVFTEAYKEGASVGPNGVVTDAEGRIVFCELGNRRMSRLSSDGRRTVIADRYQGRRLNGPNDLAFKSDGWLYFTDPWLGVQEGGRELDFHGVYRLSPRGDLELVNQEMTAPNGLAFSHDEKRLYVADSRKRLWMVFDVNAQGGLVNGQIFRDLAGIEGRPPDGFRVDERGNVWSTAPGGISGGIWIMSPDGRHLGTIQVPERPSNLVFGDADRRTLYIAARTSIYRMRVKVRGAAIPFS